MGREGNHIDLLISLLIRFPQIGTVHYEPEEGSLRLVFLLHSEENDFGGFIHKFRSHLLLFHELRQENVDIFTLEASRHSSLTKIEVQRDLASISLAELNLIVAIVEECYSHVLVQEGPETEEDEQLEQNDIIETLLSSVPTRRLLERLTGFRENGRVLVFSIPRAGVSK